MEWAGEGTSFHSEVVSCFDLSYLLYVNFNDCHSCYDNQILGHVGQPPYLFVE